MAACGVKERTLAVPQCARKDGITSKKAASAVEVTRRLS